MVVPLGSHAFCSVLASCNTSGKLQRTSAAHPAPPSKVGDAGSKPSRISLIRFYWRVETIVCDG